MPTRSPRADARRAALHARLRWTGAPLFVTGGLLLVWAFGLTLQGGPVWLVLISVGGTLIGLTSFGVNHDTAMALALQVRQAGHQSDDATPMLPDALDRELSDELAHDREEVLAMQAAPGAAMVMPLVGVVLQGVILWQLLIRSGVGSG
ncbi:MAG: hypothetical protein AAFV53_29505 [Myxococcota bacterium]